MSSEKRPGRPAYRGQTGPGRLINLGFNNVVVRDKVVAVVAPDAAPIKRLKDEARRNNKLIDATSGRRTRAVLITESDHVILASVQPETIIQRFK